jgi:hypothetical protein
MDDAAVALLVFVTLQRFIEFIWDWLNTQRLRAPGGIEFGGLHYPVMILVHASWLAGLWVLGYNRPVVPAYLIAFLILQIGRYWVLATLGRRWYRWRSIFRSIPSYFWRSMRESHISASRSRIRRWLRPRASAAAVRPNTKNESARSGRALSLVLAGVQRLALSHAMRGMSDRVMPISANSRSPS